MWRRQAGLGLLAALLPIPLWAHGDEALPHDLWSAWQITPVIVLGVALVGAVYWRGLRACRGSAQAPRPWQPWLFGLGVTLVLLSLESPLDAMADHSFWVHQIQHELLRMLAPMLIVLGAPLLPMLRGLPGPARHRLLVPVLRNRLAQGLYQLLVHPVSGPLIYVGALYFWQIPRFHDLAIRDDAVHELMHVTLLITGVCFWWLILDPRRRPLRASFGIRILIVWLTMLPNTVLGAYIALTHTNLYTAYDEVGRLWDLAPLIDQEWGGLILWIPGDMMSFIGAALVFLMWLRRGGGRAHGRPAPLAGAGGGDGQAVAAGPAS